MPSAPCRRVQEARVGVLAGRVVARLVGRGSAEAAGDRAHLRQRPSSPAARAWTSTLPSAVASTGPASTAPAETSAVSWQSSALRAPPPITWIVATSRPVTCLEPLEHQPVLAGQRDEDAAHELARSTPAAAARRARTPGDPRRHVARRAGSRRRRGRTAARRARRLGEAQQLARTSPRRVGSSARRHSCTSHRPITLRSRRVVPSTPRSLVRLKRRAPRRAPARRAPGRAATTCRREDRPSCGRAAARRRTPRRCRGGDGVDRHVAERRGGGAGAPSSVPGSTSSPENGAAGSPSRSISVARPAPVRASSRPVVEAFVDLVRQLAAQPAGEQVGHERDAGGRGQRAPPSSASSWKTVLIGIVWMPVAAYSSSRGDALVRALDHAVGARVAVVERQAEHAARARRAARSRRPTRRRRRRAAGRAARAQAVERLGEQREQVPAQAVGQPHRPVREAVHLLELHAPAVQPAAHHAAALGAEVDRGEDGGPAHSTTASSSPSRSATCGSARAGGRRRARRGASGPLRTRRP